MALLTQPLHRMLCWLFLVIAARALWLCAVHALLGGPSTPDSALRPAQAWGVALALVASVPVALGLGTRLSAAAVYLALALASALLFAHLWGAYVRPQDAFADATLYPVDPILQVLGSMAFCMELLCFLASLSAVCLVARGGEAPALLPSAQAPGAWRHALALPWARRGSSARARCAGAAALAGARLALLLALPLLLSLVLPPAWTTAAQSWQAYAASASPYSLLPASAALDLSWLPGLGARASAATTSWPRASLSLYEDVAVYYAVLGSVIALGCAGLALRPVRTLLHRRLLVLPLPLSALQPLLQAAGLAAPQGKGGASSWYSPSLGEAALLTAWLGLIGYWVRFWAFGYARIAANAAEDVGHERAHAAARALGHLCTLFLSFALLPLARGSLWETVFAVPYERALNFHRLNGGLFWLAVTAHGGTWAAKWAAQGLLAHNLAATGATATGAPSPLCLFDATGSACAASSPLASSHANNFTIPLMASAWLVMTLALLVAVARRHLPWEAFAALHSTLLWVILAAELHALSHFYHTLGGLALYALDKVTRAGMGSLVYRAQTCAQVAAQVTLLEVLLPPAQPSSLPPAALHPGAYFLLCIPSLASTEWHPFTAADWLVEAEAGAGGGGRRLAVFNIKAMGPDTWSGRLLKLARSEAAGAAAEPAPPLAVHLCGPYGGIPLSSPTAPLLAVAGGIGITPILALARALLAQHTGVRGKGWGVQHEAAAEGLEQGLSSSLLGGAGAVSHTPSLALVWVVQQCDMLGLAAETLVALLDSGILAQGVLFLHVTREEGGAGDAASWPAVALGKCSSEAAQRVQALVRPGRPSIEAVARQVFGRGGERGEGQQQPTVVACGPAQLTMDAAQCALSRGWEVHTEVFHY